MTFLTSFHNVKAFGTMGDGSLILLALVMKIIPPPPGVSQVSKDHKLNVDYQYIGFVLNF